MTEVSPSSALPARKNRNPSLALIFFIMLMDVMGISLLLPVAPQLVLRFSSKAIMVTMIAVVYAAGQFVAAPIIGKLGDRYGRRPVLLISILGQSLGYLVFGFGGSMGMLLLGRLIGGITAGNLSTANAYIADVSKPEERAKNFALIGTAWSLGMILGPALGGVFGQISLEAPAFAAALLALVGLVTCFFILPESLPAEKRELTPMRLRDLNPIASIFDMARLPGIGLLLLVNGLFSFAFNGVMSTSTLFAIQKFSAVTWQLSLLLILMGIAIAISNTFVVPKVVPVLGEIKSCTLALISLAVTYAAIFFAPSFWMIFPLNMLASFSNSFIFPAIATLSTKKVAPQQIGTMLGVNTSVSSLTNILGPLWAGSVYDGIFMGTPYWMGALILLAAAWMVSEKRANRRRSMA